MVNLEEILGENKLFYEPPRMTIKRIDFSDILTTSGGVGEPTDDSYEFSQREVSNRLMNQLIKKNTPTTGVKICDLQTRLNLLK